MSRLKSAAARRAHRLADRERYRFLVESEICPGCAAEATRAGRVLGPLCAARRGSRYRAYRAKKLAAPNPPCRACLTKPPRPGKTLCQPCADRYAAYQRERALWRKVA